MASLPTLQSSTKRIAISKANAQMVIAVGIASFVTVFCLIAANAVFTTNKYQAKVVSAKEKANTQLGANLQAFDSLVTSYKKFDGATTNVIGGSKTGGGDKDGSNSKLVLDALPSTYDFPALTSSVEKILSNQSYKLSAITGTDDQVAQQGNVSSDSPTSTEMPFSFTITSANYDSTTKMINTLEQSIRPLHVDSLDISGGGNDMSVTVKAHTFYQPGKSVNIKPEVVK